MVNENVDILKMSLGYHFGHNILIRLRSYKGHSSTHTTLTYRTNGFYVLDEQSVQLSIMAHLFHCSLVPLCILTNHGSTTLSWLLWKLQTNWLASTCPHPLMMHVSNILTWSALLFNDVVKAKISRPRPGSTRPRPKSEVLMAQPVIVITNIL